MAKAHTKAIATPRAEEKARGILAAIVESSDDAIISKSLEGVIVSWNSGAEKLFGYTAAEAIGQPINMLIPSDRADEEPHILSRVRRGERIEHYETVRRRKDGCLVDISLTVSPIINSRGKIIGASKIARDITERKRMEAELRSWHRELESRVAVQKLQLLEEGRVRKRLEADIAEAVEAEQLRLGQELHDGLAQELTGIGMMLEVLEQKLMKASPAGARELRRLRAKLRTSAANARGLAKGFYPVEIERHGLLVALQELARRTARSFGISCTVQSDEEAMLLLREGKGIQLFRIAQEAIHNATKHAKAKHISIRLTTQDHGWNFTIKDDGVGLSCDLQKSEGMGLRIMQYRARMIGATCDIRNNKKGGVILSCSSSANDSTGDESSHN
jgi:PAS domain S-box-containing protein